MGIITGEIYSFKVIATNYIGDSNPSGILANILAGSLPTAPINFMRATTVTPVDTKISLQWTAPTSNGGTPINQYIISWNGGAIGGTIPQDLLALTASHSTFYTISGLTRGQTYKFSIAAENLVGVGPQSTVLSLVSCQAPNTPTNVVRLSFNSQTTIMIGWNAPTDNGGSPSTIEY